MRSKRPSAERRNLSETLRHFTRSIESVATICFTPWVGAALPLRVVALGPDARLQLVERPHHHGEAAGLRDAFAKTRLLRPPLPRGPVAAGPLDFEREEPA